MKAPAGLQDARVNGCSVDEKGFIEVPDRDAHLYLRRGWAPEEGRQVEAKVAPTLNLSPERKKEFARMLNALPPWMRSSIRRSAPELPESLQPDEADADEAVAEAPDETESAE